MLIQRRSSDACRRQSCSSSILPRRFKFKVPSFKSLPSRASVLDCSSPLELSAGQWTHESAGGPAHSKTLRDSDLRMPPSRFITDLPKDLVEVWNVKSGWCPFPRIEN